MPENFLTFKKLNDEEAANDLVAKLEHFKIPYEVEDTDKFFDPSFARNPLQREIQIKLNPDDFALAQTHLENYYKEQIKNVDSGYYLFEFSDEELRDILVKPDEWGGFDYQLAQQILKDRGKEIQPQVVENLKKQRNEYLAEPQLSGGPWVPVGYLFAVLGGFIGLFIGWHLYKSKKTLPDGRSVYTFRENDRKHGQIIFYVSCIVFPVVFISRIWMIINGYSQ